MDFIEIDSVSSKEAFISSESSHCPVSRSSQTNLHSEQLCENANELYFNEETDINSSLFILTTHLAQVQFRLKQILETAPNEDRFDQLKSLEEFTFQGISSIGILKDYKTEENLDCAVKANYATQRNTLKILRCQMHQLRRDLSEINEQFSLQTFMVNEQSKVIKDLKQRSSKNTKPNKKSVAVKELLTKLRLNEEFILELKAHIKELENFNRFKTNSCSKCKHCVGKVQNGEGILQRFFSILEMLVVLYLGFHKKMCCTTRSNFGKGIKVNHWGDLRAKLEIAIHLVKELAEKNQADKKSSQNLTREERYYLVDIHLIVAVRKNLTAAFRDLMEHGVVGAKNSGIVPMISCFERRNKISSYENQMHAWEVIIAYYNLKNGDRHTSSAHFKLSESFNLNIHGISNKNHNNKTSLLVVIKRIISSHAIHKRSSDLQLKAFICAGLNANKLVPWLTLIFQCNQLIKLHYLPWSYVAKTHFQDSLRSLDVLSHFQFDLPVDLAVQQFHDIKDIFS